jgi:chaperone required for assembly of F1-ATPase
MSDAAKPSDRPHRFYDVASISEEDGEFAVRLDGRIAKTAGGRRLSLPTRALAARIAEEWTAQGQTVDFSRMPLTRLAFTAIDHAPSAHDALAAEAARFVEADLLCYFAEGPGSLIERQERAWGPWLAWAEQTLGLVLIRARGVSRQIQPPETSLRAKALAASMDDFALSGLVLACGLFGSAVLAYAVALQTLAAEDAFELSRLDEGFQEERWGIDAEAAARTDRLRAEARMIGAWFSALRDIQA